MKENKTKNRVTKIEVSIMKKTIIKNVIQTERRKQENRV